MIKLLPTSLLSSKYTDSELDKILNRKYRYEIEIMADMVKVAKKGALKTQIMDRAGLSAKLLRTYLPMALDFYLLFFDEDEKKYKPTTRGKDFLEEYKHYSKRFKELKGNWNEVQVQKAKLEEMLKPD